MTPIISTPIPNAATANTGSGAGAVSSALDNTMIASNFTTFLQLLTTQLKNQNPLDPLDTNQFTQQLVQFAQVEQQMKSNDSLSTLVSIEQTAQSTSALALVGQTAYTGAFGVQPGNQAFTWDGRGNDGRLWPDGSYTLTATGVDASGQSTGISTQIQAPVQSVDLTQTPPILSINGQNYTLKQIQKIVAPGL